MSKGERGGARSRVRVQTSFLPLRLSPLAPDKNDWVYLPLDRFRIVQGRKAAFEKVSIDRDRRPEFEIFYRRVRQ